MPEFLTQQPVLSLIVAAVTALIVLWAVARRAPGNLPMIIGVGLLIGAVGAGIVAYQFAEQKARETAALEAKKKALEQAREKKLREEQARKKAAEAERRKARNQAEKAAREKAARDKAAAERRRAAQLSPRSVGQSGASNQPPTAAPKGVTGGSAAPESAAADARKKWDVVPVFYGTDREAVADGKRARYSAGRGERLEVGRALVTVPKSHEVPNIERPWVYKIPFFNVEILREEEDPAKHFTMR